MYLQNASVGAIFYQKTTVQCILESILNYALCTHGQKNLNSSSRGHPFTTKYKINICRLEGDASSNFLMTLIFGVIFFLLLGKYFVICALIEL